MTDYLNIGKEKQSQLLKKIKQNGEHSYVHIAKELGVVRSMVLFYFAGKHRIPREKLEKLAQLSNYTLETRNLPFIRENYSLQKAAISSMSETMAEFLGILYGDGCIWSQNYTLSVSGDACSDRLYHLNHIAPMIEELFGLKPRFKFEKKDHQGMHTLISSKMVHAHLAERFSFPIGHKKGKMAIPLNIYTNDEYKKAFLRGLFDTDGGVHRHHLHSVQVHFTSADPIFLDQVYGIFKELGFRAILSKRDIKIFDRKEVVRFFEEIRPANLKHLYKFQQYLETGIVPRHRDIDYDKLNAGAGI